MVWLIVGIMIIIVFFKLIKSVASFFIRGILAIATGVLVYLIYTNFF